LCTSLFQVDLFIDIESCQVCLCVFVLRIIPYILTQISQQLRVAICDQLEDQK
jgi:hypothetical protein